jgi:flavin-dependent dehydrogenase
MLWGTHAELLPGGELRAGGTEWRPRWIVAADGVQSRVRRAAGLDHSSDRSRRYAFRSHFAVAPWMDCVEVYWAPEGQAYVTPIGEREVCVALAVEDKNTRLAELPRIFPALAERLAGAMPTTSERGAWTICRRLPKVTRGSVVLIGDACGSVDAITGSGLALAFQQALALGEALPDGDLNLYEEKCRELSRGPHMLSRALVFLGRHPRLQNRAIQACRENGGLLADLVEAPWGAPPLWRRLPGSLARFGWNCIAA